MLGKSTLLGEYPLRHLKTTICLGCVLLLGASLFGADVFGAAPKFTDIASEAGLTHTFYCGRDDQKDYIIETLGGGVALLDYDRDGYLDAFFVTGSTLEGFPSGSHPSNQLYRNNRDGTFKTVTGDAGLTSDGWGQGACAGDIDNDGFDDLFVTFFGQNHLYRNTGKGRFEDITERSGISAAKRWSTGCAFLDYDRDGLLDLFVANYIVFDKERVPARGTAPSCRWKGQPVLCGPRGLTGETNELYQNLGGGKFKDVSEPSGIASVDNRYSLSVTTLDHNRDGWLDIYVAVDSQASILFENQSDGTFEDVGVFAGVAFDENGKVQAGMGSAAADIDGDGNIDLVKTNFIEETSNIYMNKGDDSFEDRVYPSGVGVSTNYMGWGVGFLDYDRDTWPDILVVNGHVHPKIEALVPGNPYKQRRMFYRNLGGGKLANVTVSTGTGVLEPHSSRGLALGDFDNDGDIDAFVNNMNESPSLLRNDTEAPGGFLSVKLTGVKSNRSAIGARVSVTAGGREMVQEVRSGSSFMSSSDFRLHFGLAAAKTVEMITIDWPYEKSQEKIEGAGINQFITITEGKGITERKKASGSQEN